jgi:hypothetical protein
MLPLSRESYYAALTDRLMAKCPGFKKVARKWFDFTQVATADQPGLLVLEGDQHASRSSPSVDTVWRLDAILIIYARTTAKAAPGAVLNGLIDEIEQALERQPDEAGGSPFTGPADQRATTLGGVVRRAWIVGDVLVNPGSQGEQGQALIPIELLVTP